MASEKARLFPSIGHAVLLVIGVGVVQFALGLMIALTGGVVLGDRHNGVGLVRNPWVLGVINTVVIGACLAVGMKANRESKKQFFALRPFAWSLLPPILVTSVSLAVVMDEMAKLVLSFFNLTGDQTGDMIDMSMFTSRPIGGFLAVVIIAPFTEEYLFRGLILRGLLTRCGVWAAIFTSAFLFGVMHANLIQFILGFVIGSTFGWWLFRTKSVAPGLIGHATFNAVAFFAALLPGIFSPIGLPGQRAFIHQPAWLTLSAIAIAGVGFLWFKLRADVLPAPRGFEILAVPPLLPSLPPVLAEAEDSPLPPLLTTETIPVISTLPPILSLECPPILESAGSLPPLLPPESDSPLP